jgi:hypothetical protein
MWRLLLSGLLCVPALVLLALERPIDPALHVVRAPVAATPAATTGGERQPIVISLPRTPFPGSNLTALQEAANETFAVAPEASQPAPSRPKPARALHARAAAHRQPSAVVVAQPGPQEPPDNLWSRLARWFARHEAPRVWAPNGGEGAG